MRLLPFNFFSSVHKVCVTITKNIKFIEVKAQSETSCCHHVIPPFPLFLFLGVFAPSHPDSACSRLSLFPLHSSLNDVSRRTFCSLLLCLLKLETNILWAFVFSKVNLVSLCAFFLPNCSWSFCCFWLIAVCPYFSHFSVSIGGKIKTWLQTLYSDYCCCNATAL